MLAFILLLVLEAIVILFLLVSILFNYMIGVIISGAILIINGRYLIKRFKENKKYKLPTIIVLILTIVMGYIATNSALRVNQWQYYKLDEIKINQHLEEIEDESKRLYDLITSPIEKDIVLEFIKKSIDINQTLSSIRIQAIFKKIDRESIEELSNGIEELRATFKELNSNLYWELWSIALKYAIIWEILREYE